MGWDPTTWSALAGVATRPARTCGLHGDDTAGGRCGTCDQLAYDKAEAHLDDLYEQAQARNGGDL